ncbi:Hybrid signal transduction histidine kinase B [Fusarium oxysporum f. sp. raphani]|uniref:Hybrid signal transduction histidine kinase B n=1 Tax=Fusarium oxysporum f. sp. raphani TaxID=96318 RepID=A0A8J5PZD3_FUSOX|nr:Hybrid signal transduction histidine kinase B [Fusarium oxysporum f. sp. raphani]
MFVPRGTESQFPQPSNNLIPSYGLTTSPDATLTAFCQLAAFRLNTSRALVSLFDRARQFVVAEATQHVRLLPNSTSQQTNDGLWLCGTNFPRSFGVCERVVISSTNSVLSHPLLPSQLPVTVINDLADDKILCHRPYCHAWPNNRFYAGIPLITPRGIVIGVLCVFDSQPRCGLDETSETLLRDLAQSVMTHLEKRRFNYSNDIRLREDRLASTCASAAGIMRDALEVDGLLLLDASHSHRSPRVESGCNSRTNANESSRNTQKTHGQLDADDWCPVLGSSVTAEAKQDGNSYFGHSTLYASTLKKLLRYYPRGTIWTFDSAESDASDILSDDSSSDATNEGPTTDETGGLSPHDSGYTPGQHHIRQELRKAVLTLLPDVTSVAFFPIWNAQKRRWFAGGFAHSNKAGRVFSPRRELSYLRALGTVLMAEVSFIKEHEVELSKLDVLDSISHELRSPLHGIFFGVGVLRGGNLNPSQDDALLSVEACSRTLLDTIDQILDWSKINHFTSSLATGPDYTYTDVDSRALRPSRNNSVEAGMMSIASEVDLPLLIEDVIESVHVGHEFQKLSHGQTVQSSDLPRDRVKIVANFKPSVNWSFHVQAGAIRRIVMNVLGNSLRFTSSGAIYIQLEQSTTDDAATRLVRLTITDTGCGMSREFLANNLFSPFKQQNMINAGTGLGLSIVRRIIQALGGTVEVQSAASVGTTVCINLPLKLSEEAVEPKETVDPTQTIDSVLQHDSAKDVEGLKVSLVGFQDSAAEHIDNPLLKSLIGEKESMSCICRYWLGAKIVEISEDQHEVPHVVLCDDRSLNKARSLTQGNKSISLVVVCQNTVMARKLEATKARNTAYGEQNILFTHQPIGPRKLTRIFLPFTKSYSSGSPHLEVLPASNKDIQLDIPSSKRQIIPPTPPAVQGENRGILGSTLPNYAQTSKLPRSPLTTPPAKTDPMCDESATNMFLLVDDNPINLKMLVMFMKKLNLQYSTATDGQQAVAKYKESPKNYKCVFMDISMPVMNGFEATRAIRAIEADGAITKCPIFALTGLASRDAQQEALLSGIDLFLTKPIQLTDIKHFLESKALL